MAAAIVTLNEMAEELEVDSSMLRHQIRNGRLTATKVGPIWTVTRAEVERYRKVSLGNPGRRVAKAPRTRAPAT